MCKISSLSKFNTSKMHFVDTQQARRSLPTDGASSMESLMSSGSMTSSRDGSSSSNSVSQRRRQQRSFFHPAEVEMLPSAVKRQQVTLVTLVTFVT
jgi:hypothetical protein